MSRHEDSEIERRLRADAQDIEAEASTQLRARIDASIRSAKMARPAPRSRDIRGTPWWAAGLTGIAAAMLIVLLVNRDWRVATVEVASDAPVAMTVTPEIVERLGAFPLKARTADFTSPLEQELLNLQSDLEKARDTVEHDLRLTL